MLAVAKDSAWRIATPLIGFPIAPNGTGEGRDSFLGRLLAQLNRFKQYPRTARKAGIEGVVMLHFVMDAQGKVIQITYHGVDGEPILRKEGYHGWKTSYNKLGKEIDKVYFDLNGKVVTLAKEETKADQKK